MTAQSSVFPAQWDRPTLLPFSLALFPPLAQPELIMIEMAGQIEKTVESERYLSTSFLRPWLVSIQKGYLQRPSLPASGKRYS